MYARAHKAAWSRGRRENSFFPASNRNACIVYSIILPRTADFILTRRHGICQQPSTLYVLCTWYSHTGSMQSASELCSRSCTDDAKRRNAPIYKTVMIRPPATPPLLPDTSRHLPRFLAAARCHIRQPAHDLHATCRFSMICLGRELKVENHKRIVIDCTFSLASGKFKSNFGSSLDYYLLPA